MKLDKPKVGKPFQKGHDSRRNLKGRPKAFEYPREIAQQIADETVDHPGTKEKIKRIERILRTWADSDDPRFQIKFFEVAYGKVPDYLGVATDNQTRLVVHFQDKLEPPIDD